jgi:FkbM family methyltransferase
MNNNSAVGFTQRLISKAVVSHIRYAPVQRGKWRLLNAVSSLGLVCELERGVYVRIASPKDAMEKALVYGWKEKKEADRFLSFIRPGMTVFDVGSNLGTYSMLAARRVGPNGRVHAFEPTPRVAAKVERNAQLNGFDNIIINQVAVSSEPGMVTFYTHEEDDRNSMGAASETKISVPATTLDLYVQNAAVAKVDAMKIDAEGAEVLAFRGGERLLAGEGAPDVILLEVSPEALSLMGSTPAELNAILRGHRYDLETLAEHEGYQNVLARKRP